MRQPGGGDFQRSLPPPSTCDSVKMGTSAADFDAVTGQRCPQELPPDEQEACRVCEGVLGKELKAVLQDKLQCGAVRPLAWSFSEGRESD